MARAVRACTKAAWKNSPSPSSSTRFAYAPADHGLWGIEARCAPDKEEALLKEIGHQLLMFQEEAPNQKELDRAKRQSLLHQVHSQKTMSGKAASLGRGWLYQRDPHLSTRYHEHLQAVTPAEILAVARRYFHSDRENLVSLVPKVEKPSAATLAREAPARPVPQSISLGGARGASTCRSTRCRSSRSVPPSPAD